MMLPAACARAACGKQRLLEGLRFKHTELPGIQLCVCFGRCIGTQSLPRPSDTH